MARRRSFASTLAKAARDAERARKARERAEMKAAKEAARAEQAYLRAKAEKARTAEKERKEQEKENARLYVESQIAGTALKNEQLEQTIKDMENLLADTLSVDDYLDLDKLKRKLQLPVFSPGILGKATEKPLLEDYLPEELKGMRKFVPGASGKYKRDVKLAQETYKIAFKKYQEKEAARQKSLAEAKAIYEKSASEAEKEIELHNAAIEEFKRKLFAGEPEAVVDYFMLVLDASSYPDGFPQHAKVAYVPESKQLVVEYDIPPFSVIPEVGSYKYVKAKDEITTSSRPATQRKALYASVTTQITLRTIHELFEADRLEHIETIVFNGHVDSIDPSTGLPIRPCLITVRTTRDVFTKLDLSKVDPIACLKGLNAGVSAKPDELAPVRPVLEFNMVDSRFVEETDVLSTLDQRPNLMELTPMEFESLITNLFQTMGLETRQTQASRDGGVDCVAFDPRPIFGGKVIIQAKRYKHTVGVSAVRDLFGTLQNEGASKGILVTTSGYGKAAFEFAAGKPLELLDGSNLLFLLAEHAGIEAKIEPPENWKDPIPDVEIKKEE